jgi:putative spermidine/putrescine transport system ATP-binding protein
MNDNQEHVRFANAGKSYDDRTFVVKGLDLQLNRGEFLTLLGPSGSGKSTVLMLLTEFESLTRGEILIDGRSVNRIPPQKRNIGVVFQNYALFPHMKVRDNLRFPLSAHGIKGREADKKIDRVLDMVRLGDFDSRYPKQLSGGQRNTKTLIGSALWSMRWTRTGAECT